VSKKNNNPDFDFEAVMRSKSWNMLDAEEHRALEGLVAGEAEYTGMRETLLAIAAGIDRAEHLTMPREARNKLMDMFDLQTEVAQDQEVKVISIRRKRLWFTGAAVAASLLVMATLWWVMQQNDPNRPLIPNTEVADNRPKTQEKITTPIEDQETPGHPATPLSTPGAVVLPDLGKGIFDDHLADDARRDATTDTVVQLVAMADLLSGKELSGNAYQTGAEANNATVTMNLSQNTQHNITTFTEIAAKTVKSERPIYQTEAVAKKKGNNTHTRPVSHDPKLIGFLYACQ
jgi:hypothetical protein